MSPAPRVTVVTPVYNQAALVGETIESVLSQDYSNLEYILFDDGSTDGTRDVLAGHASRARVESHPNMGEARTVNRGFSLAGGELVVVVNSDDPLLPGAISRLVDAMVARPDALVAYPDWRMIDERGDTIEVTRTFEYRFADMVRWHHCMPGPAAMMRKTLIDRLGGRDPQFRFVGDFDFWLRAGLLGPFIRVPEILATFRVHRGSASVAQKNPAMAAEHVRLVDKFFALEGIPNDILALRREAYSSAYFVAGVVSGNTPSLSKLRYFARAILRAPLKYLGEYRGRLAGIAYHLLNFWKHP